MKYIIFDSTYGVRIALFTAPTTHADEAAAHRDWQPKSAGYLEFLGGGRVRTCGYSDSLNLRPDPYDAVIIEIFMAATLKLAAPVAA